MTRFVPTDLTTHPSLLVRVRDGTNHQAWSEFVAVYGPLIYSFCRKRGLQESDAADVSQEVLSRVAGAMAQFDYQPDKGRFRSWLGTITFRELSRLTGGRKTEASPSGEAMQVLATNNQVTSDWDDHFHASLLKVALERIQHDFDAVNWQAFKGVWLDLQSADKVAEDLGITVDKVYVAKSRILKRLRTEVLQLSEDAPLS